MTAAMTNMNCPRKWILIYPGDGGVKPIPVGTFIMNKNKPAAPCSIVANNPIMSLMISIKYLHQLKEAPIIL